MRAYIVHLSDIHFESRADVLHGRTSQLVTAIAASDGVPNYLVLAVTGDIANRGVASQYTVAVSFFKKLYDLLTKAYPSDRVPRIGFLVTPGNHDCDFGSEDPLRDHVLKNLPDEPLSASDVASALIRPQRAYADFQRQLESLGDLPITRAELADAVPGLATVANLDHRLEFVAVNSAVTSRRHEVPNSLRIHLPPLSPRRGQMRVLLMHHFPQWFSPDLGATVRDWVSDNFEVVMTGHEHRLALTQKVSTYGTTVQIEGGPLQDRSSHSNSSFGMFFVDFERDKFRRMNFLWNGRSYDGVTIRMDHPYESDEEGWTPGLNEIVRRLPAHRPRQKYLATLRDPGLDLQHQRVKHLTLPDFFVSPMLRRSDLHATAARHPSQYVSSKHVRRTLLEASSVIVVGEQSSGRTALARMVALWELEAGRYPVFVDGMRLASTRFESVRRFLANLADEQYTGGSLIGAVEPASLVAIVDDFLADNASGASLLRALAMNVGKVYLFSSSVASEIREVAFPDIGLTFQWFHILPLGKAGRNELVRKWSTLGRERREDDELGRQLVALNNRIDSVLGRNFVPSYPPYILSMIQAVDLGRRMDTSASTHGAFYEVFIREAIRRSGLDGPSDVIVQYMSEVAHNLYHHADGSLSADALRQIYVDFAKRRELDATIAESQVTLLEQCGVLERTCGRLRFRYPYQQYYFHAVYLRDRLHMADGVQLVHELIETLHEERSANTLLFLAHLVPSDSLVDDLLDFARRQFEQMPCAELAQDAQRAFSEVRAMLSEPFTFVDDQDPHARRARTLESMDEADLRTDSEEAEGPDSHAGTHDRREGDGPGTTALADVNRVLKAQQVLGQLLKNFPGRLTAERKREILVACVAMGQRMLSWFFGLIHDEKSTVVAEVARLLKDEHPRWPRERRLDEARKVLQFLALEASFGIICRTVLAVGAAELKLTYDSALRNGDVFRRLVHAKLALDCIEEIPDRLLRELYQALQGNEVARWVLRRATMSHLQMVPTQRDTRQSLCRALEITYKAADTPRDELKMLDKSSDVVAKRLAPARKSPEDAQARRRKRKQAAKARRKQRH